MNGRDPNAVTPPQCTWTLLGPNHNQEMHREILLAVTAQRRQVFLQDLSPVPDAGATTTKPRPLTHSTITTLGLLRN